MTTLKFVALFLFLPSHNLTQDLADLYFASGNSDSCFVKFLGQVYLWYPLNIVTGGTTAKIMVAAKDNFLGKYIYKDTLARNLAAVIYNVSASEITD